MSQTSINALNAIKDHLKVLPKNPRFGLLMTCPHFMHL